MKLLPKSRKGKLIVGAVLIFCVFGYLLYAGIRDTQIYYATPSEVLTMQKDQYGEGIRMGGVAVGNSVEWDAKNLVLKFEVADDKSSVPVVYRGVVPDTFKTGSEVVVEGTYAEGVFNATVLMPKCASKYE